MARLKSAPVTPTGVRDGDAGVLVGLCERRGPAVLAYCRAVCEPGRELDAAAEALAGFRAAVSRAEDPYQLDPESLLVSLTRHAAAARASRPPERPPLAPLRFTRRSGRSPCPLMPELLVARAERTLSPADVVRLTRHLQRCPRCQATAERFRAAERAYREDPDEPLPEPVIERLFAALAAAAPVADAMADTGGPQTATAPRPITDAGPAPGEAPDPARYPDAQADAAPAEAPWAPDPITVAPVPPDEPALAEPGEPTIIDQRIRPAQDTRNGDAAIAPDQFEPDPGDLEPAPDDWAAPLPPEDTSGHEHPLAPEPAGTGYARPILVGRRSGWGWRWVLPAGVLVAALAAALALAGVFSSGPTRTARPQAPGGPAPGGGLPASRSGGTPGPAAPGRVARHHHHRRRHPITGPGISGAPPPAPHHRAGGRRTAGVHRTSHRHSTPTAAPAPAPTHRSAAPRTSR